jgi:two-component system, chemotaxis family, chemotaxis protein CheY
MERVRLTVQCLLIDQNAPERQRIALLLSSLGLTCDELESANETQVSRPDVIFMDVTQADAAHDLIQQLQHGRGDEVAPKIICYADALKVDDLAAFILAGADDVIVKPFDRELLRFKLEQAGLLGH